jgi:hypothetical protein
MSTLYGKISYGATGFSPFGSPKYLQGPRDFIQSNSVVAKLAFLLLVIFLFIILLRLGIEILGSMFSISSDPILINGMVDGEHLLVKYQNPNIKNSVPILRSQNQRDGLEFTWSVWVWIKNPPLTSNPAHKPGQYKHIFNKGNDNVGADGIVTPNNAPGLYIGPNYRDLVVIMNTFENIKEEVIIGDIPIEKWVNVIIRCDQRKLDVYINGTLTRSHTLNGVPKQNYDNVHVALNGGFAGNISALRYFSTAIGTNKIQSIVDSGPNLRTTGSSLTQSIPHYLSFRWFFPQQSSE